MSFQHIGGLLPRNIKRAGISHQIQASLICQEFDKLLAHFFIKEIVGQAHALYFKDNTLTIAVLNSALAQELKFKEQEIIDKINRKYGQGRVRRLRFLM